MAAQAVAALAPLVLGAFHKRPKEPNRQAILARYRSSKPVGYVTPEDQAAAERTRSRIAGAATSAAQRARQMNARQVTARGLSGPAAAALEQGATDTEAAGGETAALNSADQLYKAFESNLGYARNQNDTAFGAEMGLASQDAARAQAQDSTFWNSMLEAIPAVASGFPAAPAGAHSTAPTAGGAPTATAPGGATGQTTTYAPTTPAQRAVHGPSGPVYR
jgi:hypothetical protein